jgi:hypothetical protein
MRAGSPSLSSPTTCGRTEGKSASPAVAEQPAHQQEDARTRGRTAPSLTAWHASTAGLLLGVTSASKACGAQVLQWTDNGTAGHLWTRTAS